MPLVLTKVAPDGIVMAADAALTESYKGFNRFLISAAKLLPHPASGTCLGTWGHAVLPNRELGKAPIPLEFVLREFLDMERSVTDADTLTRHLMEWLLGEFNTAGGVIGIDVASVRAGPSQQVPVVYRLMNSDAPDGEPRRPFRRHEMRPAGPFDADLDGIVLSGGDLNASFWVDEVRAAMRNSLWRTGGSLAESAEAVAGWLPVIVRAVSDMYSGLQIGRSIGGPVSTYVLMTVDGQIHDLNNGRSWPDGEPSKSADGETPSTAGDPSS